MCWPGGSATMNSLMKVATFLLDMTSHSHSLMSSTDLGTSIFMSSLTLTWHPRRQWFLISLREKCTVSVGRMSPPPSRTWTRHCAQLPLPPHADGRNMLSAASVDNNDFPDSAFTSVSPLMSMATSPECTK